MFKQNVITAVGDWINQLLPFDTLLDSGQAVVATRDVEFIGGPLDGLIRQVDACEYWRLPVVERLPRSLQSMEVSSPSQLLQESDPGTVATYSLDCVGPDWCYRYQDTPLCTD